MPVPHHRILDVLPCPSVREKINTVLGLPEDLRPMAAWSLFVIVQFSYDLENTVEGMRIWRSDTFDSESRKVEQLLREKWWVACGNEVIEQSNMWRQIRRAATFC